MLINPSAHLTPYIIAILLTILSELYFTSPWLLCSYQFVLLFLVYLIDYAITVVPFFSLLSPPLPCTLPPPAFPPCSCPWVTQISSFTATVLNQVFIAPGILQRPLVNKYKAPQYSPLQSYVSSVPMPWVRKRAGRWVRRFTELSRQHRRVGEAQVAVGRSVLLEEWFWK